MLPFRRVFGSDLRSLGLFRASMGALLLYDLADRARDLNVFYTDEGILPRVTAVQSFPVLMEACIHLVTGTWFGQAWLFAAMGCCAAALLVGWRARLAGPLCWYLWVSLQCRTPPVLYGMDNLLRLLLFWGMFTPWAARFSLDAALAPPAPERPQHHFSAATAALLLQVAIMYWFTAAEKDGAEWVSEGSALYYTLQLDQFATPFGVWLRRFPEALRLGTFATLHFEWLGPFLLFSPVAFARLRWAGLAGFCALQVGIAMSLAVGLFPVASLIAMIPFVPSGAWDMRWLGRARLEAAAVGLAGRLRRTGWSGGRSFHRLSGSAACAVWALLAYTFAWNLVNPPPAGITVPESARWPGYLLRLDQDWAMFAPFPMKDDGWFVVRGVKRDGTPVDLLHGRDGEPSLEKPAWVYREYKNKRWKKFLMNLREDRWYDQRNNYAAWLCRSYNKGREGQSRLAELSVAYMMEETLSDSIASPVRQEFLRYYCY